MLFVSFNSNTMVEQELLVYSHLVYSHLVYSHLVYFRKIIVLHLVYSDFIYKNNISKTISLYYGKNLRESLKVSI